MEENIYLINVRNGIDENGFSNFIIEEIINNEIVKTYEYDNMGECLSDLGEIQYNFYENNCIDTRFDEYRVLVNILC